MASYAHLLEEKLSLQEIRVLRATQPVMDASLCVLK